MSLPRLRVASNNQEKDFLIGGISFTTETLDFVLEAIGKKEIDGMICDIETGAPVIATDGKVIDKKSLICIWKGEYIRNDFESLMNLVEARKMTAQTIPFKIKIGNHYVK